MRFGVREICNVVLRAKAKQTLGSRVFYKNEPVLYFDTLKTSSLEGASTTVYATGGRGNTRLVAWEGERTLTFTMEDALISPEGFAILSGAGLVAATKGAPIYVHTTSQIEVKEKNTIELPEIACWNKYSNNDEYFHSSADIFVMTMTDGQIDSEPCIPAAIAEDHKTLTCYSHAGTIDVGDVVLVDYYVKRTGGAQLIEITADKFGGNYYLEASTLFRRESDGVDMPAEFIIPNCKVQSNFTFSMASSGDPSTFTFTMDAFPDYTKFDKTHKVLAAIQVIEDASGVEEDEFREACIEQDVVDVPEGEDRDITVTYDNTSNRKMTKVTVTGSNIKPFTTDEIVNAGFEDADNPKLPKSLKMITVDIDLPVEAGKNYRLVTRSPMHKYYPDDNRIKKDKDGNLYKEQTITENDTPITTAITNEKAPITFELYELISDSDTDGILVKTVSINNQIKFA